MPPEAWVLVGLVIGLVSCVPVYGLVCWLERRFRWDTRRW